MKSPDSCASAPIRVSPVVIASFTVVFFLGLPYQPVWASRTCSHLHHELSVLGLITQIENQNQNQIFEQRLTAYERQQDFAWYNLTGKRLQRKLNQNLAKFKHPENVNAFLKDLLEVFYPTKVFKSLFSYQGSKEASLKTLAKWHLLQVGVHDFISQSQIPLHRKPLWKKSLANAIRYTLAPYKAFDPLKVKLEPDLAEKILLDGLDKLSATEKDTANLQYLKMYALKNAEFLGKILTYSTLVVLYFQFEKSDESSESRSRVIEYSNELDKIGKELKEDMGPDLLEKALELQLQLLIEEFRQVYKREPTPDEVATLKSLISGQGD